MRNIDLLCPHLKKDSDGIWMAEGSHRLSYPEDGNDECFAFEDGSFWFKHRNECLKAAIQLFANPENQSFLDIGGGNGFVARDLERMGYDTLLIEPGYSGARNAHKRGLKKIICATVDEAALPPSSVDSMGLFDVLEHIEDDVGFLSSVKPLLKSSGYIFLTVPAHPWLWSAEDNNAGHFRRYTTAGLSRALAAAGFDPVYETYIFQFLPFPIFLFRSLPYRFRKERSSSVISANAPKEHKDRSGLTGKLMQKLFERELRTLKNRRKIRFGASCLIVARPTM